jgi:hypothetical protein
VQHPFGGDVGDDLQSGQLSGIDRARGRLSLQIVRGDRRDEGGTFLLDQTRRRVSSRPLPAGGGMIGRDPTADVQVDEPFPEDGADPTISRHHCTITPAGPSWVLRDCSANGTAVRPPEPDGGYESAIRLRRDFPWYLVAGTQIILADGRAFLKVVIEDQGPVSSTPTGGSPGVAHDLLPLFQKDHLQETALELTKPYRRRPPSHVACSVGEIARRLHVDDETIRKRLNNIERLPAVEAALATVALSGGSRYQPLAEALVSLHPGFGDSEGS